MPATRSRLLLLLAAFLFSTAGAGIKATTLTGWQVSSFRCLVAGLVLPALIPAARRGWSPRVILPGMVFAATMIFFVLSTKLTTAANAIFLQSTAPLYLMLIGPWLLKEKVRRRDLPFMIALAVGLTLFFVGAESPHATAPDPARGNIFGAMAGVAWAFTIAGLRWAGGESSMACVVAGNLFAFVAALPGALPVTHFGAADLAVVLYLGIFQIGLAYVCVTAAIRHVPALEASTLMLAEPAFNPLWAWLLHGERPGTLAMAGGAIILLATLVRSITPRPAFRSAPDTSRPHAH